MKPPLITLDIDWAPDWIIDEVATYLIQRGVRATWFVTHPSPAVERLKLTPHLFELGIHPNFLENSTQGRDPEEIFEYLSRIVPKPISVRTHALFQSTPMFVSLFKRFQTLQIDLSLFLPHARNWEPITMHYGDIFFLRFPYIWEDDVEMFRPEPVWHYEKLCLHSGWPILDFHPIHLVLNDPTMDNYCRLKRTRPQLALSTQADFADLRKTGSGPRTMFTEAVEIAQALGGGLTVSGLATRIRSQEILLQDHGTRR